MTDWRPSRRTVLVAGIAFAAGLLLFALLWWRDRGSDFYRAPAMPESTRGQEFEPLPAPLPADRNAGAGGLSEPAPGAPEAVQPAIETPPPPTPPVRRPPAAGPALAPGSSPVPVSAPAPEYPREALRNGDSGTVLLRVHVGADGVPQSVDLVRSSRSRALDRAATDAVKRWRFRPAQRDGRAVAGDVQVPIVFTAD